MTQAVPLLAVDGLTRRFGGLVAVDGVSLQVMPGEIVGLLGPNGSGKTTVLNLISGALKLDGGSVTLRGGAIAGLSPHRIARLGVARTFQLVRVLGSMTCRENVLAGLAFGTRNDWSARGWAVAATYWRPNSPISTRSGWNWPARSRCGPNCCCWMNGWPASIPPNCCRASIL